MQSAYAITRSESSDLGGPEALSPLEVEAIFEEIGGRQFEITFVPEEALAAQQAAAPAGCRAGARKSSDCAQQLRHLPDHCISVKWLVERGSLSADWGAD